MIIEISKAYKQSLSPLAKSVLAPLNLPKETFAFLTTVGLALHTNYHITPNAPLIFLKKLKEVDPESIAWRKFFWRRMCEPDIV